MLEYKSKQTIPILDYRTKRELPKRVCLDACTCMLSIPRTKVLVNKIC